MNIGFSRCIVPVPGRLTLLFPVFVWIMCFILSTGNFLQAQAPGSPQGFPSRNPFLPPHLRPFSSDDKPMPVDANTIIPSFSQMEIIIGHLELPDSGNLLLLGRGTGYIASYFSSKGILVTALEMNEAQLAEYGRNRLALGLAEVDFVENREEFLSGNDSGRFDAILIHGSTREIPASLFRLLRETGVIIGSMTGESGFQVLVSVKKANGIMTVKSIGDGFFPSRNPVF